METNTPYAALCLQTAWLGRGNVPWFTLEAGTSLYQNKMHQREIDYLVFYLI